MSESLGIWEEMAAGSPGGQEVRVSFLSDYTSVLEGYRFFDTPSMGRQGPCPLKMEEAS